MLGRLSFSLKQSLLLLGFYQPFNAAIQLVPMASIDGKDAGPSTPATRCVESLACVEAETCGVRMLLEALKAGGAAAATGKCCSLLFRARVLCFLFCFEPLIVGLFLIFLDLGQLGPITKEILNKMRVKM